MKKVIKIILYTIAFGVLLFLFIYLGNYNFKNKTKSDNEYVGSKFTYLNHENVYKVVTLNDIKNKINGDAIILVADAKSVWADYYAKIVNNAAMEADIKEVLLYNNLYDRDKDIKDYNALLDKLDDYLTILDTSDRHLFMPALIIIKNGEVAYFDNETAITSKKMTIENYWTSEKEAEKTSLFVEKMKEFKGEYYE